MKRDLDFCRTILLRVGDAPSDKQADLDFPDRSEGELVAHIEWLEEGGLLDAEIMRNRLGQADGAIVQRLTWEGCDFLDASRDPSLWQKARTRFLSPGVSFTFEIVKAYLKREILGELPDIGTTNLRGAK